MQRKNMRRIVGFAKKNGLGRPENRPALEDALTGCSNKTTRAKLRAKILRGEPQR